MLKALVHQEDIILGVHSSNNSTSQLHKRKTDRIEKINQQIHN